MKPVKVQLNATTSVEVWDVKHNGFYFDMGHTMLNLTIYREGKDETSRNMKLIDFIAMLKKHGVDVDGENLVDEVNGALDQFRHDVKEAIVCAVEDVLVADVA